MRRRPARNREKRLRRKNLQHTVVPTQRARSCSNPASEGALSARDSFSDWVIGNLRGGSSSSSLIELTVPNQLTEARPACFA